MPSAPTTAADGQTQASASLAEHDGLAALTHVRALAEGIGPRTAGTAAEAAAVQYIQSQLSALGYHVETLAFDFPDPFRPSTIELADRQIEAWPMIDSPAGTVAGQAVRVGLAREEDLAGLDLDRKVAIARRGEITFGQKAANVRAAGAAALIVVNHQPGPFRGRLGRETDIPVLAARGEDWQALEAAATAGDVVRVVALGIPTVQSNNVLATSQPGARCEVLVGAHHDTVPDAPGANDNASGTANVLELARAFAADGLDDGLCFATFGAEESGLHGSRALAARLQQEDRLPGAMVNLDVTGRGDSGGDSVEVIGSDDLVALAARLAAERGTPARPSQLPPGTSSDHESFSREGVPVVYLTSGDFAAIHTPQDTIEHIDPAELDRVGDLAYAIIQALLRQAAHS